MEISLLKAVLNNISSFFHLPSYDNIKVEAILKYYQKAEVIMRLLKTVLDVIVDSEIASNEALKKPFEELGQSVNDLREQFVNWKPLSSKVYFVSSFFFPIQFVCELNGFFNLLIDSS